MAHYEQNEQISEMVEQVRDLLIDMSRLYDQLAQRGTYNPARYWHTVLHVLSGLANGIELRMHDDDEYIEATNRYDLRRAFRIQCRLEDVEDYLLVLFGVRRDDDEEAMDTTEDEDADEEDMEATENTNSDDDEGEVEALDKAPIDQNRIAGGDNEDEN